MSKDDATEKMVAITERAARKREEDALSADYESTFSENTARFEPEAAELGGGVSEGFAVADPMPLAPSYSSGFRRTPTELRTAVLADAHSEYASFFEPPDDEELPPVPVEEMPYDDEPEDERTMWEAWQRLKRRRDDKATLQSLFVPFAGLVLYIKRRRTDEATSAYLVLGLICPIMYCLLFALLFFGVKTVRALNNSEKETESTARYMGGEISTEVESEIVSLLEEDSSGLRIAGVHIHLDSFLEEDRTRLTVRSDLKSVSGSLDLPAAVATLGFVVENDKHIVIDRGDIEIAAKWTTNEIGFVEGTNTLIVTAIYRGGVISQDRVAVYCPTDEYEYLLSEELSDAVEEETTEEEPSEEESTTLPEETTTARTLVPDVTQDEPETEAEYESEIDETTTAEEEGTATGDDSDGRTISSIFAEISSRAREALSGSVGGET